MNLLFIKSDFVNKMKKKLFPRKTNSKYYITTNDTHTLNVLYIKILIFFCNLFVYSNFNCKIVF